MHKKRTLWNDFGFCRSEKVQGCGWMSPFVRGWGGDQCYPLCKNDMLDHFERISFLICQEFFCAALLSHSCHIPTCRDLLRIYMYLLLLNKHAKGVFDLGRRVPVKQSRYPHQCSRHPSHQMSSNRPRHQHSTINRTHRCETALSIKFQQSTSFGPRSQRINLVRGWYLYQADSWPKEFEESEEFSRAQWCQDIHNSLSRCSSQRSVDWTVWLSFFRMIAENGNVWDLINPDFENKSEYFIGLRRSPLMRKTLVVLIWNAYAKWKAKMGLHKTVMTRYEKQREIFKQLIKQTQSQFSVDAVVLIANEPSHWCTMLQALKLRFAPSDETKKSQIEAKYHELCKGPGIKTQKMVGCLARNIHNRQGVEGLRDDGGTADYRFCL